MAPFSNLPPPATAAAPPKEFATRAGAKSSLLTNGPAAEVTPPARAAGPHLPPEAFRRSAADQGVAGDVERVGRRAEIRLRMRPPGRSVDDIGKITDDLESPRRECRDRAGLQRVAEIAAAYAGHEGSRKSCRQDCLAPGDGAQIVTAPISKMLPRIGTSRNSTPKLRLKNVLMALPALHRLKEAVAVGVGDAERVVDDVGVAVPRLPVERVGHERIGAHHAPDQGVVHPAVEVNEADIGQLFLAGEAADGLAGDAAGGIVRPGGEAPLAPSVIRSRARRRRRSRW